jgi:hypothetical protein
MSRYVTVCHGMLRYVTVAMSRYVTVCAEMRYVCILTASTVRFFLTVCHGMSWYVRYVTVCYGMSRYVTVCYGMSACKIIFCMLLLDLVKELYSRILAAQNQLNCRGSNPNSAAHDTPRRRSVSDPKHPFQHCQQLFL